MIGEVRKAACVAIGDELLAGEHADSNSGAIAVALAELGIEVERFVVLGDDRAALERTFYELTRDFGIVVATGGIGPTLDDVTREAAAGAAGVQLELDAATLDGLREASRRRGREMARSNERQAWFPGSAQIMPNRIGTAPGFRLWIDGGVLAVLPGPPHEMRAMLEEQLVPWIRSTCGQGPGLALRHFYLIGLAESTFADRVGDWMARDVNPRMGVTAHTGTLWVTLRARAESRAGAEHLLERRATEFRERFSAEIYSESDPLPQVAVARELIARGLTLATAESCTGGLLAEMLTDVPGISAIYRAGWVTYSNEAKSSLLGVDAQLLERHGAVSCETAAAMALGAAGRARAEVAIAITGIAGPEGGTPEKPVGLVCFGLALHGTARTFEVRFPPVDRASIRRFAAHAALDFVRRHACT